MDARTPKALKVPGKALVQKTAPVSLGDSASSEPISDSPKPVGKSALQWEQVNPATWRLIDPDGRQVQQQACHGFWGGYNYPKALAYVFDVGVLRNHDWRIRVRRRGDRWQAFGSIIDADTAKRIAQQAVENPTEPKPSKFTTPSNLLGGYRWDAPALDSPTRVYIRDAEIGAVRVESPNEQPEASESINPCATDDDVALQRLRDLADETMDEAWTDWPPAPDDPTDTGGAPA
jgi:hypothetical protein